MVLWLVLLAILWPQRAESVADTPHSDQTWRSGYLYQPTREPRTIITPDIPQVRNGIGNGQCTALVKKIRPDLAYIRGAAKTYLAQATETGLVPRIGAVVQTKESAAGHVSIVIAMTTDTITIKEQNYQGLGIVSTRTLSINDPVIAGYIYQ